eukprot:6215359-Amphidinium_carterae.1
MFFERMVSLALVTANDHYNYNGRHNFSNKHRPHDRPADFGKFLSQGLYYTARSWRASCSTCVLVLDSNEANLISNKMKAIQRNH